MDCASAWMNIYLINVFILSALGYVRIHAVILLESYQKE